MIQVSLNLNPFRITDLHNVFDRAPNVLWEKCYKGIVHPNEWKFYQNVLSLTLVCKKLIKITIKNNNNNNIKKVRQVWNDMIVRKY